MITLLVYILICIIIMSILSVIIFYGIYYNPIKLTVWILSIILISLLIELLVETNFTFFLTYINLKRNKPATPKAELKDGKVDREENVPDKSQANSFREDYVRMKTVFNQKIFKYNYQAKKQYESLNHKFGGLSNELYRQSIYLFALLLLIYGTRNSLGYYSTDHNKKFVYSEELNRIPLDKIYDDDDVWTFIEEDFLRKVHEYKNGWIHGHVLKILGVPRLRQLRIQQNSIHEELLDAYNEDRENYLPNWQQFMNFRYGTYYWRILDPWIYRTGFESKTLPMHGNIKFYSSGGYVCQLGRNMENSLKITAFLRKSNWIDDQTRVIFVEYTFYGADANLFNVNTIILEKTVYGHYIVTPYIQTANLLIILEDLSIITIVLFIVMIFLTLFFFMNLVRELLKKHFIYSLWNYIDLAIVTIISVMIVVYCVRNLYVHNLLREMEHTRNNKFISFYYAALFDLILAYVGGILICISTIRLWKILNYIEIFYALTKTLQESMKSIAALTLFMCICLMGYGLAVFVVNGSDSIIFYNFVKVLTSLTALSFGFIDDMSWTNFLYGGTTMGLVLYFILLLGFNIFIMNMFITVIMYHLDLVKQEENVKFYTLLDYSKERCSKLVNCCCCRKRNNQRQAIKDVPPDAVDGAEPIENKIPNITGTVDNAAIKSQIDYATALCDNIDWDDSKKLDKEETIPDSCGLIYPGRNRKQLEHDTVEKCGLLYRSKESK